MLILSDETREKLETARDAITNALNEDAMGGNQTKMDIYLKQSALLLEMVGRDEAKRRGGSNA